ATFARKTLARSSGLLSVSRSPISPGPPPTRSCNAVADQLRVIGGRRLRQTMKAAGLDPDELKATNAQVAGVVASAGRPAAPAGPTGGRAASVRPGATKTLAAPRAGFARAPYAGPAHWGGPQRNNPAQPFLSHAAAGTEGTWEARYMRFIEKVIQQIE